MPVSPAHVLVDMDGVLADWTGLFNERISSLYPHLDFPFLKDNSSWEMATGATPEMLEAINLVKEMPGFYADLKPIEGGRAALEAMLAQGFDVSICTSPWIQNPTCASDKLAWLDRHIGHGWADRAIITKDKTTVRGDFLIDDKPDIKGIYRPEWEHIVFDAPYNKHLPTTSRRISVWEEWHDVIWGAISE